MVALQPLGLYVVTKSMIKVMNSEACKVGGVIDLVSSHVMISLIGYQSRKNRELE